MSQTQTTTRAARLGEDLGRKPMLYRFWAFVHGRLQIVAMASHYDLEAAMKAVRLHLYASGYVEADETIAFLFQDTVKLATDNQVPVGEVLVEAAMPYPI